MATFKLRIVTPEKVFFDGEVSQITARTSEGNTGIMAGHVPYIANIEPSALNIKENECEDFRTAAVSGGFIKVSGDETIVVTSAVEWAEDIDVVRAQHAKEAAERKIKENASKTEFERAEQKLKRAVNRLSVSENH